MSQCGFEEDRGATCQLCSTTPGATPPEPRHLSFPLALMGTVECHPTKAPILENHAAFVHTLITLVLLDFAMPFLKVRAQTSAISHSLGPSSWCHLRPPWPIWLLCLLWRTFSLGDTSFARKRPWRPGGLSSSHHCCRLPMRIALHRCGLYDVAK